MRKRSLGLILFVFLIITSIVFTSCSSKTTAPSAPAAEKSKGDYAAVKNKAADSAQKATAEQAPNRKLIVRLFMEMRVDDVEKSINDAEAMALTAGGYIRESYQNTESGQLTIMIPAGRVDTFTSSLKSLGKMINSNRNTEDVTDSYFDTQIRIKNLETEIETMRNLLQKQGWKISEILEIEREIRRLTDELETLKGYLTNLDRQVTYSEVRINFTKSQAAIDTTNQDGLGYKLQLALKGGVNLLVQLVTSILTVIVFILPISPFVLAAYFIVRFARKRLSKKAEKDQSNKS